MPAERLSMRKVREVLRLKHAMGMSYRKISEATGIEDDKTIDARLDEIIIRGGERNPPPGAVDGSGCGGPDPTTPPPSR